MKKILAIIIISITILLCGCGATDHNEYSITSWGVETYKADNGKEYYVFTTPRGVAVVEK